MTPSNFDSLTERLERLERQHRTLKVYGALLLVIVALVFAWEARPTKAVLEAERFVLRDSTGRPRATLAASSSGFPFLAMYGENGVTRAELAVEPGGQTGLRLLDPRGSTLMALKAGDRRASLDLLNDKIPAATFELHPDGTAALRLGMPDRWHMVLSGTSGEFLRWYVVNQKQSSLHTATAGTPELSVRDGSGVTVWKTP